METKNKTEKRSSAIFLLKMKKTYTLSQAVIYAGSCYEILQRRTWISSGVRLTSFLV